MRGQVQLKGYGKVPRTKTWNQPDMIHKLVFPVSYLQYSKSHCGSRFLRRDDMSFTNFWLASCPGAGYNQTCFLRTLSNSTTRTPQVPLVLLPSEDYHAGLHPGKLRDPQGLHGRALSALHSHVALIYQGHCTWQGSLKESLLPSYTSGWHSQFEGNIQIQ